MQRSQIPSKITTPFANSAGIGYKRPIPTPSQIGIQDGAASWTDGFPPLNFLPQGSGGVPPFGQDFNGLLNIVTAWLQWMNAGGAVPYFDTTFAAATSGYPSGAFVQSATLLGQFWISTADNNTGNPDTGAPNWTPFPAQLTTPKNYYVNTSIGSDTNNGLSPTTPFKTIGKATGLITLFNQNGFPLTINVADGTYNEGVSVPVPNGSGGVYLQGNSVSPQSVVIQGQSGVQDNIAIFFNGGSCHLNGFKLIAGSGTPPGGTGDCLAINNPTQVFITNVRYGYAYRAHLGLGWGSTAWVSGNSYIDDNASEHYLASASSNIVTPSGLTSTPTVTQAVTFSQAFALCSTNSLIGPNDGFVNGVLVTGVRFNVSANGVISSNGNGANYYPGTSAGVTSSGGQYV